MKAWFDVVSLRFPRSVVDRLWRALSFIISFSFHGGSRADGHLPAI